MTECSGRPAASVSLQDHSSLGKHPQKETCAVSEGLVYSAGSENWQRRRANIQQAFVK